MKVMKGEDAKEEMGKEEEERTYLFSPCLSKTLKTPSQIINQ